MYENLDGRKKCKNLNDGYGRINREFFFFFFFFRSSSKNHSYTSKLLDTFGNWQTRSAVGTDRITESDGSKRERERVVGGVKNAKGVERCYREGLENCSSVGKSPTCSSQIFTSISVRLELNLE